MTAQTTTTVVLAGTSAFFVAGGNDEAVRDALKQAAEVGFTDQLLAHLVENGVLQGSSQNQNEQELAA